MDSPIPVPSGLVVKNALKIWLTSCGGNPTRYQLTDTEKMPIFPHAPT